MSDDKDRREQPSPSDWIRKLETSAGGLATDPIHRVAKHLISENGLIFKLNDEANDDHAARGRLHFSPPNEWRKTHPFSIPKGMHHTDSGAAPFSVAVEGGYGMVMWLQPTAIASYLPKDSARQLLEDRAEMMCAALKNKCDIRPLEVRIYYPPQKIINATSERGHEVRAALILATDEAHRVKLRLDVHNLLIQERTKAEVMRDQHTKKAAEPLPVPSSNEIRKTIQGKFVTPAGEVTPQDPLFAVKEIASATLESPELYTIGNDGKFNIEFLDDTKKTQIFRCTGEDLGIANSSTHVMVLRLDKDFLATPTPTAEINPENNEHAAAAVAHDKHTLRAFYESLGEKLGGRWYGSAVCDTPMGDLLTVATDQPNQGELLKKACRLIEIEHGYHVVGRQDWAEYLDERGVNHRPPQRR